MYKCEGGGARSPRSPCYPGERLPAGRVWAGRARRPPPATAQIPAPARMSSMVVEGFRARRHSQGVKNSKGSGFMGRWSTNG